MKSILLNLARAGDISWLSFYFAEFIAAESGSGIDDLPALSAALVSEHSQAGNVCVDLGRYQKQPLFSSERIETGDIPLGINVNRWRDELIGCGIVGNIDQPAPLWLEDDRLYLYRYWVYEDSVANWLLEASREQPPRPGPVAPTPSTMEGLDEYQRNAVATAAARRFCVVSGGPGSGKTSTVVQIIALLLRQDPNCRIALAAPTGKAAARMMESIKTGLERIGDSGDVLPALPAEASTLHRLLGYSACGFEHHAGRPVAYDCVVVDEASMIDLKLMHHLLTALPSRARLILLGDRDQLAAVAAGNVLGDITGHGYEIEDRNAALSSAIALLEHNYRFDSDSAIGEFSLLVNKGRSKEAVQLLAAQQRGLGWYRTNDDNPDARLIDFIVDGYQRIYHSPTPGDALESFAAMRVLSATNHGPTGVEALNRKISGAMLTRNRKAEAEYFHGMPIMIARNSRQLGLYNGDVGILWQSGNRLRACFDAADGGVREYALNRLPEFQPAWATTVHKSQGSEYATVVLFLPPDPASAALSRELIYTAVTRARSQFILHGTESVLTAACARLTRRHSGLALRLGWTPA